MTNFKETLPQVRVIRKTGKKRAISQDRLTNADEKQILCTIKKILEHNLKNISVNIEDFRAHLDDLNKELDYYKDLIESVRKDAILMSNMIEHLSSENIKMKNNEH